jgi:hypothetical protein
MKKSLLSCFLIATLCLLLASCKKGNNESDYYFKIKLNGNWVTYTDAYCELGPDMGDPSLIDFVVNGGNDNELMSVAIQSETGSIVPGSFNTSSVSPPYYMIIDYWKISPNDIQVFGQSGPGNGNDPFYTLNITSITATEIRGNFTGNYLYDSFEDESVIITEGEFVAQRID